MNSGGKGKELDGVAVGGMEAGVLESVEGDSGGNGLGGRGMSREWRGG